MLWRPGYQPRVTENPVAPPLLATTLEGVEVQAVPALLIGGFSVSSVLEQDVWRRLVDSAAASEFSLQVVFGVASSQLLPFVPPSRRQRYAVAPSSAEWERFIEPDQPSRSFALAEGLLVVGPPTEEVWERFEAIVRRLAEH